MANFFAQNETTLLKIVVFESNLATQTDHFRSFLIIFWSFLERFWTHFWSDFGLILGRFLRSFLDGFWQVFESFLATSVVSCSFFFSVARLRGPDPQEHGTCLFGRGGS